MEIVKDLTVELIELDADVDKYNAIYQATKTNIFAGSKRKVDSLIAKIKAEKLFWTRVRKTWPETKAMRANLRKDSTILFTKQED